MAIDEKGIGGANHKYKIMEIVGDDESASCIIIPFQNGARNEDGSVSGVLDMDLLEIARDRLRSFQNSEFSCESNAKALTCVNAALGHLNKRVEDRAKRNVLGRNLK